MKPIHERRKLKNYLFVNKAQVAIFVSNLILLLLVIGIVVVAVLSPFYSDIFKTEDIYLQNLSSKLFIVLLERCALAFFIILIPVLIQQVFVIHKICGPFVNFKKTLNRISDGDLSQKIHLRRYDFFQKEAHQINGIIDNISNMLTNISDSQNAIVRDLDGLASLTGKSDPLAGALKNIESQTRRALNEVSRIKVIS
ncbi:MAG: methyl-accepting chemotaxis protein [Proteobacteria bacterium]|nr:methyl-accepting chemotaxis protein [Pseudomonadota bacterium]